MARPGRLLVLVAAAVLVGLRYCFVPSSSDLPKARNGVDFNPAVAASAALPVLTMLAEDAEAKYGDNRKWSAVLVPLTTLVFPITAFGVFVLYSFTEDAFWRSPANPGTPKAKAAEKAWREHPLFADIKDPMFGLLNPDDYEKGLEEAWERAKPAGSTVTVKEKLAKLSKQNAPHWVRGPNGESVGEFAWCFRPWRAERRAVPRRVVGTMNDTISLLGCEDEELGDLFGTSFKYPVSTDERGLRYCFLGSPEQLPKAKSVDFNPAVAASAALPALTLLAEDAEAKYGDNRKWSAVLVPLTTLVFPITAFGVFVLYSFTEDAFWRSPANPGTPKAKAAEKAWREHPLFADIKDPMFGLLNPDDYEKGLEEAWERAKPAGSTVTVKEKLAKLSKQNAPHWETWNKVSSA
ncbi:Uncharacterized protein SCF082_LOCUS11978 [Durusdinium trenchii]|uniref:Uncharacterized protein n=1 Tax=Durusdinium trenchii TaxID=1381693 RepID=A0ABP0JGN1_9DINO